MRGNLLFGKCLVIWALATNCRANINITIDLNESGNDFQHFWTSTGLCPPDPKSEAYKYLLNNGEKINLALIGALPNRGIQQVRIHWLFNTILDRFGNTTLDYTYLDEILTFLNDHNLKPAFELMGLPTNTQNNESSIYSSDEHDEGFWKDLVRDIVVRSVDKFGVDEVSRWKFETWNEPDLKNYNLLNFTLAEYLHYVNGCAEGLRSAFSGLATPSSSSSTSPLPVLGGPAGLFKEEDQHPLCWGLLETCNNNSSGDSSSSCPIQFISFHRKGDGTAEGVLNGTLELLDLLHNKFPNLAEMPIANDESDVITSWSDSWGWRGDTRYAAMVVKIVADIHKSVTLDRKLKIEVLSNDNGFLNYHPFYFTQRTLFARFQMNRTHPPHDQFIKKPVYSAMALLSLLGEERLGFRLGPQHASSLLTVLPTRTIDPLSDQNSAGILLAYANDDEVNNVSTVVDVNVANVWPGGRFAVYLLDNIATNPYKVWQDEGAPVFPRRNTRKLLRSVEGPSRLAPPQDVSGANVEISLKLSLPSVVLLHICSDKGAHSPGPVTKLAVFNITGNEVLLTWSDAEVNVKCIRTYEVELESACDNSLRFRRVNDDDDTIFLSYHYASPTGDGTCEGTIGRYRVRAVDYWDRPGGYSEIVSYP